MSSPEPSPWPPAGPRHANPFTHKVRQRISGIPERTSAAVNGAGDSNLNGFSVARIYTTFQLKREEFLPSHLSNGAFDIMIDLYLFEWLNRRVGAPQGSAMRLTDDGELPPGATELITEGLAELAPTESDQLDSDADGELAADSGTAISLSRVGRARLNLFFDYMANYMSAI